MRPGDERGLQNTRAGRKLECAGCMWKEAVAGRAVSLNRVVRKGLTDSPCAGTYKPASEKSGARGKDARPDRSIRITFHLKTASNSGCRKVKLE